MKFEKRCLCVESTFTGRNEGSLKHTARNATGTATPTQDGTCSFRYVYTDARDDPRIHCGYFAIRFIFTSVWSSRNGTVMQAKLSGKEWVGERLRCVSPITLGTETSGNGTGPCFFPRSVPYTHLSTDTRLKSSEGLRSINECDMYFLS